MQFYTEKFGKLVNFELTQFWVKSLYQRMKFSRRAAATSRAVISRSLWNKIKSQFLNEISQKVLLHSIPDKLIINAYQTPPKCVHGSQGARSYFKCKFQWQKKYYLNSLWITWMAKSYRSNWFAKERHEDGSQPLISPDCFCYNEKFVVMGRRQSVLKQVLT